MSVAAERAGRLGLPVERGFAVRARGGDARGAWVLAAGEVRDGEECGSWLRATALRLAVRLDPGPRVRWAPGGLVRPTYAPGPDAPTALRAWAEDVVLQAAVGELLESGGPFGVRFPDVDGAWYELVAAPIPVPTEADERKPGAPMSDTTLANAVLRPVRCDAETDVPHLMRIFAKRLSIHTVGGEPASRTRCALEPHEGVEHMGRVRELREGAVWVTFTREMPPYQARLLRPCAREERCGLYEGHPGRCLAAEPERWEPERMGELGVLLEGAPELAAPVREFDLPREREEAARTVREIETVLDRVLRAYPFPGGVGLSAPQIGVPRAAALVQPPWGAPAVTLLNPCVIAGSRETAEEYESCPGRSGPRTPTSRPNEITVRTTTLTGHPLTTTYTQPLARLVHHEIDHLKGLLHPPRLPVRTPRSVDTAPGAVVYEE
ncbi:peptide deformylase [Streptomyces sp. Tu6071]|uniref:peptide deformylase n=1 Tax=Streptomyces sp. Tu6071 TaxID=355249 RepID=UPI00069B66C3|nr:peptide deformylase [Streptomyces sp. Tu6071]